ncbi:MAG: XisI protein [Stigonema ocellatum SAG 48.90 = DSM 106950]|nr:XisI protein [Stigonema ocellatum SAG 48.90 = DSM 106950]
MDILDIYRQIIQNILAKYVDIQYANGDIYNETIFDHDRNRYLVMSLGWQRVKRIHGCLIHIDIIDGKVWIQRDGTEDGIANELVEAGIPKKHIVLGFYQPNVRQYTGFAVA